MRRNGIWIGLTWLAALAGCATTPPGLPPTNIDELLAVDRDFSETSRQHGFAGALDAYLVADAVRLPQDAPPVFGRPNIVAAMQASSKQFPVTWEPESGQVADSGDLGWTWGRYLAVKRSNGEPVSRGKYLNVWERQPDGSWRVKIDAGSQTPMPQ